MGEFIRERLPEPISYFEGLGMRLTGKGKWRTTRCEFHGGSDSMRVNAESGAWVCMACGEKGGDVLAHAMRANYWDFVTAARRLGAFVESDRPTARRPDRPRTLSARDAMEVIVFELCVLMIVVSDTRRGLPPSDVDWKRFLDGEARIERLVEEFRS